MDIQTNSVYYKGLNEKVLGKMKGELNGSKTVELV